MVGWVGGAPTTTWCLQMRATRASPAGRRREPAAPRALGPRRRFAYNGDYRCYWRGLRRTLELDAEGLGGASIL